MNRKQLALSLTVTGGVLVAAGVLAVLTVPLWAALGATGLVLAAAGVFGVDVEGS